MSSTNLVRTLPQHFFSALSLEGRQRWMLGFLEANDTPRGNRGFWTLSLSSWMPSWRPVRDLACGRASVSVAVWKQLDGASSTVVMKDRTELKAQSTSSVRLSTELIQQSSHTHTNKQCRNLFHTDCQLVTEHSVEVLGEELHCYQCIKLLHTKPMSLW